MCVCVAVGVGVWWGLVLSATTVCELSVKGGRRTQAGRCAVITSESIVLHQHEDFFPLLCHLSLL